jgi:hypothetical protein
MRNTTSASIDYVPASSADYHDAKIYGAKHSPHMVGHAGFVLSMGGDFFMGQHGIGGKINEEKNVYHSSYTAGRAVRCSGTWKVENGVVKEISDSSGHYKPNLNHMINALETLKTYGVDLSKVLIHYYGKNEAGTGGNQVFKNQNANEFLTNRRRGVLSSSRQAYIEGQKVETAARNSTTHSSTR